MLMEPTVEELLRAAFEDGLAELKKTGRTSRAFLPGLYEVRQPQLNESGETTMAVVDRPDRKIWVTIYVSEE